MNRQESAIPGGRLLPGSRSGRCASSASRTATPSSLPRSVPSYTPATFTFPNFLPLSKFKRLAANANLLLPERVDDGGLADVGVSDEADGDLRLVLVELRELTEHVDESALERGE